MIERDRDPATVTRNGFVDGGPGFAPGQEVSPCRPQQQAEKADDRDSFFRRDPAQQAFIGQQPIDPVFDGPFQGGPVAAAEGPTGVVV